MELYTYWQSTAAYRMRIALNLKGISAKYVLAHLRTDGGHPHTATYCTKTATLLAPAQANICLVSRYCNARGQGLDPSPYPRLT
ncbi:hypothetical protein [uncultured Aliiroseovarius sp.]|uniref:hypothetical protein n=1 Tax=uncultured Aliiroseovarius sp. TaxID=1658783 RepID=UPI002592E35A|nr:hypothetical protein [uncultured Aliiroseovarius sp.]